MVKITTANGRGHCWICNAPIAKGEKQIIITKRGHWHALEHRTHAKCGMDYLYGEIEDLQRMVVTLRRARLIE